MVHPLWMTVGALCIQALAYGYGFARLRRREVHRDFVMGWGGFLAWWAATATNSALLAVRTVVYILAPLPAPADMGIALASLALAMTAAGALIVYLCVLVWGPAWWYPVWYGVAGVAFALASAGMLAATAVGTTAVGAVVTVVYAEPLPRMVIASMIPHTLIPLFLLAVLFFQMRGAPQDYRRRGRRLAGFLVLWIIAADLIAAGALGHTSAGLTWVMRGTTVLAALGMVSSALTPRPAASSRPRDAVQHAG